MPTNPDDKFREDVQHVRWDGLHISQPDHEGFVSICGRTHIEALETIIAALRKYVDATAYKPDGDADGQL